MQQSGRLKTHHAPRISRQNFIRNPTNKSFNKVDPSYIVDYEDTPSKLEERRAKEKEERRQIRNAKIKKIVAWTILTLAILLVLAFFILLILYFTTCYLGNCPKGCYDCKFSTKNWKKSRSSNSYSASHRFCGDQPLSVSIGEGVVRIDSSIEIGRTSGISTPSPRVIHAASESLSLYWYMDESIRNNETLTLVFSDDGDQYAGAGNFGDRMIQNKPVLGQPYTWWTSQEEPFYFPYYLTRNVNGSICMFLEGDGVPVEVTVRSTTTEWVIYKNDQFEFHFFAGDTPYDALSQCINKWHELHPVPDAFWTQDFILGSFTTSQVEQAKATTGILGTHYLLSPDALTLTPTGVQVEDKATVSNYGNIFYTWHAQQEILPDSTVTPTRENGFYKITGDTRNDTYFLDYTVDYVKTIVEGVATSETQGFLLKGGYLPHQTAECSAHGYLECSTLHYNTESNMCLDTELSGGRVIDTHNNYDTTRTSLLRTGGGGADNLVFESVATPGTTHFHRDLELSDENLRVCFNNIVNLQGIGVRGVTCNMCGGVIPTETDAVQSYACDKWSMLAVLMPYVIMTNDQTPPFISDSIDAGRYVNNNLAVRRELQYELNAAYRAAIADSKPFVYPVSAIYNDSIYTDTDGVMIGERLFFAADLDPTPGDITIALPRGAWYTNGGPQRGLYFPGGREISQSSRSFSDLFFFKVGQIFVMADPEPSRDNHVIVRIFLNYDVTDDPISHDFVHYESGSTTPLTTSIKFDPVSREISFTYKSTDQTVAQDLQISKIEIYLWYQAIVNQPNWVTFDQTADKYDMLLDYIEKGETKSIFETWTQDSSVFGDSVSGS